MTFNSKIFRTSTFRLAAIYLIFFAFSVCAVLAYVYWNTVGILERQTDETIRAEVQGLSDQYRLLNLAGVADVIKRRIDEGADSDGTGTTDTSEVEEALKQALTEAGS